MPHRKVLLLKRKARYDHGRGRDRHTANHSAVPETYLCSSTTAKDNGRRSRRDDATCSGGHSHRPSNFSNDFTKEDELASLDFKLCAVLSPKKPPGVRNRIENYPN